MSSILGCSSQGSPQDSLARVSAALRRYMGVVTAPGQPNELLQDCVGQHKMRDQSLASTANHGTKCLLCGIKQCQCIE